MRWTVLGLTAATGYVCWHLWPPLILAAWTAGLTQPWLTRLERALRGRRRAAAALSILLFAILALPVSLAAIGVVSGAQELAHTIAQTSSAKSALEAIASRGDSAQPSLLPKSYGALNVLLQRYGGQGVTLLTRLAGAAANGVVGLLVFFAGAFVFLVSGREAWRWIERRSPLAPPQIERLAAAFHETGRGLLVGVGLTSATQGLLATAVYLALGISRWWVLGPITGLASMIPVVGSALVWGPLTAGLFLTGSPIKGSILAVLGLGVISTADNLLRPVYARLGSLAMPTYLVFVALLGGIAAFGTWGAILGPLIVRLWMEALALRAESNPGPLSESIPSLPSPTIQAS